MTSKPLACSALRIRVVMGAMRFITCRRRRRHERPGRLCAPDLRARGQVQIEAIYGKT